MPATWGDCMRLPALWCHRRQILAAYSCLSQQLDFWGHRNVSATLLFGCARGTALAPHFPSQAKHRLKLQAFPAAQAGIKGGGDLGCHGGSLQPQGAFSELVWAQQCKLALGFFGSCDSPKAQVEMLLRHTGPPRFPCCSSGILSFLIPYTQQEVKDNFLNGFWSSGLLGGVLQPPCPALGT